MGRTQREATKRPRAFAAHLAVDHYLQTPVPGTVHSVESSVLAMKARGLLLGSDWPGHCLVGLRIARETGQLRSLQSTFREMRA